MTDPRAPDLATADPALWPIRAGLAPGQDQPGQVDPATAGRGLDLVGVLCGRRGWRRLVVWIELAQAPGQQRP